MEGPEARREARRVIAVRAAGGVPVREGAAGIEVLVVHRPQYRDWSFPKGKCWPGETDEACAVREVAEETGLVCELERELPSTAYDDSKGRRKTVRYWRLRVVGGALDFAHEVDAARWLPLEEAERLLTYERDRVVLRAAGEGNAPG
jgi:8-oxo-dGTP diphosphatase